MAKKATKKAKPSPERRSACPIACALDVLGDKWTLLVVRDLMSGKRTYGELADSPESIPTNLLADRLKRLVAAGLADKRAYQDNPPRYEYTLTKRGRELYPVLDAVKEFGLREFPGSEARIDFSKQANKK
ncbi:putative HTH-type transcriptional regulator YybR [Planctomycetes bacterium MalM25]|nr:putative HTH-type transcriptional regulator YybR [Planctomycetes bacterium MalM25]